MDFPQYNRDLLIELVKCHALKIGDFTLSSGKKASYYIDGRRVTLSPDGALQVGLGMYLEFMASLQPEAVGGLTLGADPIVGATLAVDGLVRDVYGLRGQIPPIQGFLVRKEIKSHGTGQRIEGPLTPGSRVLVVDDVATTGGSLFQAIEAVESIGCQVIGAAVMLDRLEGAAQAFAERGIPFHSLLTIRDLGIEPNSEV